MIEKLEITSEIIGIIIGTLIMALLVSQTLRIYLNAYIKRASLILHSNPTNYSFLKSAASFITFLTATIILFHIIPGLNKLGTTLLASAGLISVVVGLAAQQAFSNFISGIFIVIYKPFRVGDFIQLPANTSGTVEDITLRHTIIKDGENRRLIVPNSVIASETITNSNIADERICVNITFNIGYRSDINQAKTIIQQEALQHPSFLDIRTGDEKTINIPAVIVRLTDFGESALVLKAFVWTHNNNTAFVLKCDLLESIKVRFDKEGIELPYPHRVVSLQTESIPHKG